jgi:hypothetical protein
VSAELRERFVLYWSSERPVPKVTIDFGDGRALERTTTGNSAHYVLDEEGRVLDVLPGLYSAPAFIAELERARKLAADVHAMSDDDRARAIVAYHDQRIVSAHVAVTAGQSMVESAQRLTVTKAVIERRDLRRYAAETRPGPDDAAGWIAIGERRGITPLDPASRRLVERIHTTGMWASRQELDAMIARLQRTIAGDTALDELLLAPEISKLIVAGLGKVPFEVLNEEVYRLVFHTPRSDTWLGLLPRTDFTGLPGDGVVMRYRI